MSRSPTLVVVIALGAPWVAACAGAPPAPPEPQAPSSPPTVATQPPPPDDPRTIRCGVDDRPRKLGVEDEPVSRSRAKVAAPRADPRPPPPPPPPPPTQRVLGEAADVPAPEPRSRTTVIPGDPRLEYGPVPWSVVSIKLHERASECVDLVADGDAGPLELSLAIAGSGDPVSVRSSREGVPTRFVRCLMDRGCGVRTSQDGAGHTLFLPMTVAHEVLPPPPPPPLPPAPIDVDVRPLPAPTGPDPVAETMANVVRAQAFECVRRQPSASLAETTVVFVLTVKEDTTRASGRSGRSSRGGGPGAGFVSAGHVLAITAVSTEGPKTKAPLALTSCVVQGLADREMSVPFGTTPRRVRISATFRP